MLPVNRTKLMGSESDEGETLTNYLWTRYSGPSTITLLVQNRQ